MTNGKIELREQIKNAMQRIGIEHGFTENVVNCAITNVNIIDELQHAYETNEHDIPTDDVLYFLCELNDIETGGVMENFVVCEHEINEYRKKQ